MYCVLLTVVQCNTCKPYVSKTQQQIQHQSRITAGHMHREYRVDALHKARLSQHRNRKHTVGLHWQHFLAFRFSNSVSVRYSSLCECTHTRRFQVTQIYFSFVLFILFYFQFDFLKFNRIRLELFLW